MFDQTVVLVEELAANLAAESRRVRQQKRGSHDGRDGLAVRSGQIDGRRRILGREILRQREASRQHLEPRPARLAQTGRRRRRSVQSSAGVGRQFG